MVVRVEPERTTAQGFPRPHSSRSRTSRPQENSGGVLRENLVVTCSGNFSAAAFRCTVMALGVDNVLFSVDWPYESNVAAVEFLRQQPLSKHELEQVAHRNAERVLHL